MVNVLFDTNILIDHFAGIPEATAELARYRDAAVTTITWSELLAGAKPDEIPRMQAVLRRFRLYGLDIVAAEDAAALRRAMTEARKQNPQMRKALPTPDAVILTTARRTGRVLITRNTKDFMSMGVYVPYTIDDAGVVTPNPLPLL